MTPPTDCAALARAQRRGGAVLYAAAKGFVSTLTRGQAKEVIGKRSPLDAVAPGAIATPCHYRYSDAATNEVRKAAPLGRIGTPQECVGLSLPRVGGADRLHRRPDHRGHGGQLTP